jgi:hypothetical protein
MKNLILVLALMIGTGIYAQDPVKDKMKETKVRVLKVEENGKMVEKKVKVTTEQEQDVMTTIDPNHPENSDRLETPIKVKQTVSFDNDMDPFYDSETDLVYYTYNDNAYKFSRGKAGFNIMSTNNDQEMVYGKARMTSSKGHYLLNTDEYSGIGYFDVKGNFVIEYYDDTVGAMVIQTFGQSKL